MGMYLGQVVMTESNPQLQLDLQSYQQTDQEKSSSLEHHGIKGQKWGIRRYQDRDGSLTDAGRRRYGVGKTKYRIVAKSPFEKKRAKLDAKEQKMTEKEELWRRKNELKERQANLKNQGKSQKTIQNESADEKRKEQVSKERERDRRDVKDMTDDELRAFINRYNMEKQYREIINGPQKKKGAEIVSDTLLKVGTAVVTKELTKLATKKLDKILGLEDEKKKNKNKKNDDEDD